MKVELKYFTLEFGGRSAMTLGMSMTRQLSAEALVSSLQKKQSLGHFSDKDLETYG